jgi:hypothetical protein
MNDTLRRTIVRALPEAYARVGVFDRRFQSNGCGTIANQSALPEG